MSGILIVGNSIKDVFLKLDERKNQTERDADGTPWINLGFNGSSYEFMKHTATLGGAAVTKEILTNFGIRSEIIGQDEKSCPVDFRYILNINDNHVAYLSSSERVMTAWAEPAEKPDWIFVDRSAEMSEEVMRQLMAYLDKNPTVRLAIYVSKDTKVMETALVARAKIVFAENNDWVGGDKSITVKVGQNELSVEGRRVRWFTKRDGLMTHLTVNTIASTTFLAAMLRGEKVEMALKLAQRNVESAALTSTMTYAKMKQMLLVEQSQKTDLRLVTKMLMDEGRGILAADESGGSIHKKFEAAGILDDAEHRRDYRNIFFTTPGLEKYINGVILFDETARQRADDGRSFVEFLTARGIIPGVKVDQGLVEINAAGETATQGLDGLTERLTEYHEMGLRFAKWRAAFKVSASLPSEEAIVQNCEILAQYARLCQQAGLVPIVEPEVLYDGNYSLRHAARAGGAVLDCLVAKMREEGVDLAACLVKVSMVMSGKGYSLKSTPNEVGRETVKMLGAHLPAEIGGVVFLSGGQTPDQATENYRAIRNYANLPFAVGFSFARAVQEETLAAWGGDNNNVEAAQEVFVERLRKITGR